MESWARSEGGRTALDSTVSTRTTRRANNDEHVVPFVGELMCQTNSQSPRISERIEQQNGGGSLSNNAAGDRQQRQRRKVQFDTLHQEMELVSYSVSETGQARRIIPRHLSMERTKKRRLLEKQDRNNEAQNCDRYYESAESSQHRKIRGPKAAAEDHVVDASLVFGRHSTLKKDATDDDSVEDNEDDGIHIGINAPMDQDANDVSEQDSDEENDDEDDILETNEEIEAEELELSDLHSKENCKTKRHSTSTKFPSLKRKKTTRLQRLKNFKSTRMAEKHGAALGAHIQGKSDVAIKKLKQIAASVPLAPQIYSSLGMVYEDLLQECQRMGSAVVNTDPISDVYIEGKLAAAGSDGHGFVDEDGNIGRSRNIYDPDNLQTLISDKSLRDQLNLAKKAYGSYHVAAILYKRDYSLWLRAADSAFEIASVHTTIMQLQDVTNEVIEYHRTEKQHWLNEAKNDYQAADNLNPPGIEIPAKLAHVMIELGMLSEALTLLTGLKNQVEFNSSYRAWLLFADLMLRIGHECNIWNVGIQTNSNKMFRRWLRKWSKAFDWKERRMQSLAKATEAACGSVCCRELMKWIRIRVDESSRTSSPEIVEDSPILVDNSSPTTNEPDDRPISSSNGEESTAEELPMTASCNTICSITSELIRHMLDMQLYHGGKLVGDCVSLYLKQREALSISRTRKKAEFDNMQNIPISLFAMQRESYDIDDDHGNDSDIDLPLSDDEDWDNDAVTVPLRRGTLPPELRFLYGLCFTGDDGNTSLASTCIQSLNLLPLEAASFFQDSVVDCGVFPDSGWLNFCETMTRPFGLLTALFFVTETLQGSRTERELSTNISRLYTQRAASLYQQGWLDLVLNMEDNISLVTRHRRYQLIKVLLAAERYNMHNFTSSVDKLKSSMTKISKLITATWKVNFDGSLESICVEAVESLSYILKLYIDHSTAASNGDNSSPNRSTIDVLLNIASIFCGNTALNIADSTHQQSIDLTAFPINSTWLTNGLESLSQCVFNLCVGINVSQCSGWQLGKKSMRCKSVAGTSNFFGLTTDDGPISGYIPELFEREVVRGWEIVHALYPNKVALDLKKKLQILKKSDWYGEIRAKYVAMEQQHNIIQFGEDHGLLVLLNFAFICLASNNICANQEKLLSVALSILLPITQFLLKETLWDSNVGSSIGGESSDIREWLDVSKANNHDKIVAPSQRPGYIRPSKRQLPERLNFNGEKSISEWFSWEDGQRPKSNLFDVPLSNLARIWDQSRDCEDIEATVSANDCMEDINKYLSKLRQCYTIQSSERLSVIIATSLLKLLEYPTCRNPFGVIHLATMFASQGPRGGTSDHLFRARLPTTEECTTHNAILILGRAECMNALNFCPEAAFLCSYVVSICRLNCAGNTLLQKQNRRWLTLSIMAYDLSVIIRITAKSLLRNSDKRDDLLGSWADAVVDWFCELRKISKLTETLLSDESSEAFDESGASFQTIMKDALCTGKDITSRGVVAVGGCSLSVVK